MHDDIDFIDGLAVWRARSECRADIGPQVQVQRLINIRSSWEEAAAATR